MTKNKSFEEYFTDLINQQCKTHTSNGKAYSHYTMLCKFKDGNKFTFRGDYLLKHYSINANNNIKNQLDALIYKYATIKDNCIDCKIYNNKKNILFSLIFHQTETGYISINNIMNELQELKSNIIKQKNGNNTNQNGPI